MGYMSRIAILMSATFIAVLTHAPTSWAQESQSYLTTGKVVRFDGRIDDLIPRSARIELLASGFDWSEGPLWIRESGGGYLIFSDIPRNSVMKWKEGAGISLFMKPSGYTGITDYGREPGSNGITLDRQGRLIFCEHGDRRVSRLEKDGGKRTLVDSFKGKRLNSPNDAVVRSNGDLYFTDPPYGLPQRFEDPRRELAFCGVFRLSVVGELSLLTKDMTRPNGIAFSPDEKVLYVAQSDPQNPVVMAFPVKTNGTIDTGAVFYDFKNLAEEHPGLPDGLKVDKDGNLFTTGPGGVYVITSRGELLGRIHTGKATANCAWGDDGSVLYVTADDSLCRIRTTTKAANWPK